jgi:hypothetical protein
MIAAVGGTTGATYGGALRFGARQLRGFGEPVFYPTKNRGEGGSGGQESSTNWPAVPEHMGSNDSVGTGERSGRRVGGWTRRFIGGGAEFGARVSDFTGGVSETSGNLASTIGSMVANASGNRLGPEGHFRFGSFRKSEPNRSSQRARNYLN